ncbi:MAG TPA: HAD family hydrolase [Candidatus Binatia bacterium]|nr:HAD family hydrolase [Candidatus Binatia bacterium]
MPDGRFVFLDRDGTLVRDVGYGYRLADYELLPGVVDALRVLSAAGYRFAIVTNQSGIARGIFSHAEFEVFHRRLLNDLDRAGIAIEATYMCPHLPDARCDCRKPSPTPLLRARDVLGADLPRSWVVGDHAVDVELAARAGCRGILVTTGHGEEERARLTVATPVVADLAAAARHILACAPA